MSNLLKLTTETRNERSMNIDNMSTIDILTTINNEDKLVAHCVERVLPEIERTVDAVCRAIKQGGRVFYVGAGTSGRIGILDAVECPPTYSTPPDVFQAVLAGGVQAFEQAAEGAEDDLEQGAKDLAMRKVTAADVVIGITASGRTPYVIGALQYARRIGAFTVGLSSNADSEISAYADIKIEVITGPEVITGSTRMKAATAHKLILNMISTASMIKVGKVYENLMVDLKVSNHKLMERAKNIVVTITGITPTEAEQVLEKTNYQVKPAIVMVKAGVDYDEANALIREADGFVRKAIELARLRRR
jgi:N-acetylmuramic acid 6-phosphate etherase